MLKNGSFDVFNGPIYDNKGIKQVNEGENLSDKDFIDKVKDICFNDSNIK